MKEQGFKIPENYFENRKASLKAITEKPESSPIRSISQKLGPWLAAAAILTLGFFLLPKEPTETELKFSEVQTENLMDFLSEDPYAVHPESFFELEDSSDSYLEIIPEDELEYYLDQHTYEYL